MLSRFKRSHSWSSMDQDSQTIRLSQLTRIGNSYYSIQQQETLDFTVLSFLLTSAIMASKNLPWTRVLPDSLPTCSTAETTSCPEITLPKTTCFPSNHDVWAVQRKTIVQGKTNIWLVFLELLTWASTTDNDKNVHWLPFVFLPAFAMLRIPGLWIESDEKKEDC